MSRRTEVILSLAVLLGLVLDVAPFLSALSTQGVDSLIDRFYAPAIGATGWVFGGLLRPLQPVAFFLFCTLQNGLAVALPLALLPSSVFRSKSPV